MDRKKFEPQPELELVNDIQHLGPSNSTNAGELSIAGWLEFER